MIKRYRNSNRAPIWHVHLDEIQAIATITHYTRCGDDKDL